MRKLQNQPGTSPGQLLEQQQPWVLTNDQTSLREGVHGHPPPAAPVAVVITSAPGLICQVLHLPRSPPTPLMSPRSSASPHLNPPSTVELACGAQSLLQGLGPFLLCSSQCPDTCLSKSCPALGVSLRG